MIVVFEQRCNFEAVDPTEHHNVTVAEVITASAYFFAHFFLLGFAGTMRTRIGTLVHVATAAALVENRNGGLLSFVLHQCPKCSCHSAHAYTAPGLALAGLVIARPSLLLERLADTLGSGMV
jgi:hypothetical protein